MKTTNPIEPKPELNYTQGALFAIGGPIVGIAAWILLWKAGFIASIATYAMAWLTLWLYRKGAGGMDRKALKVVVAYIVLGLVLSILSGMVYDVLEYLLTTDKAAHAAGAWTVITSSSFWSILSDNMLHNADFWKGYTTDILIALALGGLGVYGTVKELLFAHPKKPALANSRKA